MKTLQDIQTKLKAELKQWFVKQVHNPFGDYHLYYLPSTSEHDGGLLICEEAPPNSGYKLAASIRKEYTIDGNFGLLQSTIRRLPILDIN